MMTNRLFESIASEHNILEAWNISRARLAAEPVPHDEVTLFTDDLLTNLAALSSALRSGTWQPGPLRTATLVKPDGSQRILHIPSLADRVAERAIAAVLTSVIDPHLQPDSYGFRPGLGVDDAVRALQDRIDDGERWVIRTDFVDCFGSIPVDECLRRLDDLVPDPAVVDLVARALARPVGNVPGRGLAQGSPLSPVLVNLYLDQFDRSGWDHGVSVIRYVDDIAATATSRAEAFRQLTALRRAAHRHHLALSPDKTAVLRAGDGIPFLGRTVRADGRSRTARLTDPSRATLHVTRRGAALRASGNKFVITGAGTPNFRHAAARTRMIVCSDRVMLTTAALSLAARSGVELIVVDPFHDVSVFLSPNSGRHAVIRAQYTAAADPHRALGLAAAIVVGKIANSRVLLTRTKARRRVTESKIVTGLDRLREHCTAATSTAGLLGIEGAASRMYFHGLTLLISPDWKFTGRSRRPPRDPVNAMLSYEYTILAAEARRAVELVGFDPTQGFLHTAHRGRPSLACDLMEEFHTLLVDTTVLRLIGTHAVTPAGFTTTSTGCRMDNRTKHALIDELERRMLTRVVHPIRRQPMSYRQCIEEQAIQIARVVTGAAGLYMPMPWR